MLAQSHPLPRKMPMYLHSVSTMDSANTSKFSDIYDKAEGIQETGTTTTSQDILYQDNILKLQAKLESFAKKRDDFIAYCDKNKIIIVAKDKTEDGCVGFDALDSQTTAIHMKKIDLQVTYEQGINLLHQSRLTAKDSIGVQQANKIGLALLRLHDTFPVFSKPELRDINSESYSSGGTREIIAPRVDARISTVEKRFAGSSEGNPSKIVKTVEQLPLKDIFKNS